MSTIAEKRNLNAELESAFQKSRFAQNSQKKKAFETFLLKGLPDSKSEEYKFTPVTKTLEKIFTPDGLALPPVPSSPAESLHLIQELQCNVLAFINGSFSMKHSVLLDAEIKIQILQDDSFTEETDPFAVLNQALSEEVLDISITSKSVIQHPVAIVHWFDSSRFVFANPRWKCSIGAQCTVTILEYGMGSGSAYFNNKHAVIEVGENASLEYSIIQNGPATDIQINNTWVHASASARVSCFTVTLEGQLVRNNLTVTVDGEGVDSHLYGLYLISGNTVADNHTVVDHRKPNSYSNELYKGAMNGNAKGVFNGKIYVRPDAQKTNAFQSNRNILISETASVYTKPQLEIWADDVKCSHGCTTGQLDEEALFYLRSRGISKDGARSMLLSAFAAETLTPMKNEVLKNFLDGLITNKLQRSF